MKEIDIGTWPRKGHYLFFSGMDYPHFNICFDIEITDLLPRLKDRGLPFYHSMVYLSAVSANMVEEFRYRARDGKVVLHDSVTPSFTDMDEGSDLFKMVTVGLTGNLDMFTKEARRKSQEQKEPFVASDFIGRDDHIYITSIPWISFTHISHTIKLGKNDSVPRISWGKYCERDSKILLPFSVQVNHAFADGIHIARYRDAIMENIGRIDSL